MQNNDNPPTETSGHPQTEDLSGFKTQDLYRIALRFFKEKDGSKAVPISYKDRIHLVALSKQVSFGQFKAESAVEVGLFDVVGNDRKLAWKKLGDMPKDTAMCEFISTLSSVCPLFEHYVTAHKLEMEEQKRKKKVKEEELNEQKRLQMATEEMKSEEEKQRQLSQEMMIRLALNQQTAFQFRSYAEQQYPGSIAEQDYLIAQLQEQHFVQYMMQVYNQQGLSSMATLSSQVTGQTPSTPSSSAPAASASLVASQTQQMTGSASSLSHRTSGLASQLPGSPLSDHPLESPLINGSIGSQDNNENLISMPGRSTSDLGQDRMPEIEAASMWTRSDVLQFKQTLRGEKESVINVRSGEMITVRIPTREDGSCLFWEFATEAYDIGFGVSFEWTNATSSQLTVQVANSDMHEDKSEPQWHNVPTTDVIIPVYRRNSHIEVYCGSHVYPGRGVYLFNFDNSYSLWRSKTVLYRVYYTK